jgi:tRNA-2-methylthio-N6-dimethylallyladenosine synthase
MNELDSEVMSGLLQKKGLTKALNEDDADILIFNTCAIRDLAERKVLGKVGRLSPEKRKKQIIGITGCMANAKKSSLFKKIPMIDFVLGTNNIHEINFIIDEVVSLQEKPIRVDPVFSQELKYEEADRTNSIKAYVSIIRGCNKHCTYCVVPSTRGPEVSRHPNDILQECQTLIDKGYKEITLLGQNVNSFGNDHPEWNILFHDLLYKIDSMAKKECRIRFMTSHPVDISQELMYAIRDLPSICEFVHFPLQAGSDRILKKMHRMYTKEEYFDKVAFLRSLVPHVALGTDIIVGFPTETDEEFEETRLALESIRFSVAFPFAYSARKGTPAMRWPDDISQEKKEERLQILLALQDEIYKEEREQMLGSTVEVLVEGSSLKDDTMLKGRTRSWKNVIFKGPQYLEGTFQEIHITGCTNQTLIGTLNRKEPL